MPHPVPDPVHNFFARFLANPDGTGLRKLCINLLELELDRAQYNVLSDPPLFEPSGEYGSDITEADQALRRAHRNQALSHVMLELPYLWLTLLGHRLAVERDLPTGGIPALVHVAAARLDLPLKDTEAWSDDVLFRNYTRTVLRDEWDYPGIQFRYPRSAWPPEAT